MLDKKPIPQVWINGTFDVLHPGHVRLFRYARILAGQHGKIHVGIDTDERVRKSKGPSRPVNSLSKRISNLASTMDFDSIMSFATDKELKSIICALKPKYMVIGDDYRDKDIIGSSCIENIFYVTRDEHSSTNLINQ
jgi:D-beta-D-heptose 7-phosphate kinase/D-beta-D-heptose 1-phosphate adenosyltransferase